MNDRDVSSMSLDSHEVFFNRELSWLAFAERVLELTLDHELPLLERVKFAGIMGMLHDEFFMKRISGLKQQIRGGVVKKSLDGRLPSEELTACRDVIRRQMSILARVLEDDLRPKMKAAGIPIHDYAELNAKQVEKLRAYFIASVLPLLSPLAVDTEHPFPFISGLGLNLAITGRNESDTMEWFVRLKVPTNRPRWVAVPESEGFVPLEQIITANLSLVLAGAEPTGSYVFRVTRGAEGDPDAADEPTEHDALMPGAIVRQVSRDLKARRFAGVVRLKVGANMPSTLRGWLAEQMQVPAEDVYPTDTFLGLSDLLALRVSGHQDSLAAPYEPVLHPRFRASDEDDRTAIFNEISRGDILLHHPYTSFDTSVLRFISSAAQDPQVLAIKLTLYRIGPDSPIIRALIEAARNGKQVAVLVEITARFDEAPNIEWGKLLEKEGVHVSYGVEQLKTHVKLALVIREEQGRIFNYVHVGTGNYNTGTARIYEDLGILTKDPTICQDVASLFNQLTGALPIQGHQKLIVAPYGMRTKFVQLIHREVEHVVAGKPARVRAKMNQLQDPDIIRELYKASQVGVGIDLNVRGLCCLRPGVPGLSENIRVFSVVGRFLEHGRIYEFHNCGRPEYFIGSADWMKRNLDRRVESIIPVADPALRLELGRILDVYEQDNASRWDCGPNGDYVRRLPGTGEPRRAAQDVFMEQARAGTIAGARSRKGQRNRKS